MNQNNPYVSIIIPTYNRPSALSSCLSALAQLDYKPYEVIIVDDGGDIFLDDVISQYSVTLIKQNNMGAGSARNRGIEVANGDYIAFVDDDTQPASDWLTQLINSATQHADIIAGGYTQNRLTNNIYSIASQLIIDMSYEYYQTEHSASFFTSNNMLIPTDTLRQLGGFDELMRCSEDRELCFRWVQTGRILQYIPTAIMYHEHHLTFWGFVKQHLCYGGGAYQYRMRRSYKLGQANQSASITSEYHMILNIWNWLIYPSKNLYGFQVVQVTLLFIIWQIANLIGFLWMMLQEKLIRHD